MQAQRWASCTALPLSWGKYLPLILFPLLHSFVFVSDSKCLSKWSRISVKFIFLWCLKKCSAPFYCQAYSACLCFPTTSILLNRLHTQSLPTPTSELNAGENHINVISVLMTLVHPINLQSIPKSINSLYTACIHCYQNLIGMKLKVFFLCEKQAELINLFLFISPSMFSSPAAHHTT